VVRAEDGIRNLRRRMFGISLSTEKIPVSVGDITDLPSHGPHTHS